jgi:hypothetical protein
VKKEFSRKILDINIFSLKIFTKNYNDNFLNAIMYLILEIWKNGGAGKRYFF